MKRTTLFLVFCVAVCSGQYVNIFRVSKEFSKNALRYEAPKLEPNVVYRNFFQNLSKIIQSLINEVVLELFRQTRFQSYMLSNTVSSITDELEYGLQDTNATGVTPRIDNILEKLNKRLQMYLDLGPGLQHRFSQGHEEISDPGRVWSFITYHPLSQLFSHLETTIDLHLSNINVLVDSFYKKGWEGARYSLGQLQKEFRDVYLNGYLLHMYNKAVANVYDHAKEVKQHVNPATWEVFNSYSARIKELYDEIKPSNQTISRRRLDVFG